MAKKGSDRPSVLVLALLIALLLSAVPLSESLAPFRPDWVALVLLYMAIYTPNQWLMTSAFFCGLIMDALFATPLGQYSLALIIACYFPHKLHLRLMLVPIWQSTVSAVLYIATYQFVLFWVNGANNNDVGAGFYLWPIIGTVIVWPVLLVILDTARLGRRTKT
ncbi:MAG: rod shape-determining protein MreD [Pseudomonadota bacterium]